MRIFYFCKIIFWECTHVIALYAWFSQTQAQSDSAYEPSGILTSDLGDELPPGRLNVRFPPRDPARVNEAVQSNFTQPVISSQIVPTITAEIRTLAVGLENDPLAIYDYVYNYIDYVPSWGLLKNPRETLLAAAGNAFDQSALLAALLEAAGFQTRYVWGEVRITKTAAMNWVGATDQSVVGNIFASGGIPTVDEGSALRLSHIWIEVYDGGSWHPLDPSFKAYSEQAGQDLRSILGCDSTTFVSRAESGATITSNYVQNLNQTNIRSDLNSCALNLVNYLRNGDTFVYLEELIGGREIVSVDTMTYPASLPYELVLTSGTAVDIPNNFAYVLTVQLPGINYSVNVDDIAGERMTLFYECATTTDCQTLTNGGGVYDVEPAYQVNVVPKLRVGGVVVATGNSVQLGSWGHQLTLSIATPMGAVFSSSQSLIAGEWYALPMRLQAVSNRSLARHGDLLDEAIGQGLDSDDEQVLGEILYLLGLSYFNEVGVGDQIDSRLAEIVHIPHFSMMIVSRNLTVWVDLSNNPVALDPAAHTVDVRLNIDSVISAQNPANADRERAWFLSGGVRGSAVEHAILEQLQPISAISTIQILNRAAEDGQRIYYITPANKNAVLPLLGHPSWVTASVDFDVSNGRHVVISQNEVAYEQWQGSGWISFDPNSGSAGYLISGGLNGVKMAQPLIISGGGGAAPQLPEDDMLLPDLTRAGREENHEGQQETEILESGRKRDSQPESPNPATNPNEKITGDPIDVTSGSFLYFNRDLASFDGLGIPLGFERFYASSRNYRANDLGFGWTHIFNGRFYTSTDWIRGYGGRMALEAAAALSAGQIGLDLFDATTIPHQRFAMDVTAAQWLMTQITDNAVTVAEPDGNLSAYVLLSDGKYQSPPDKGNLNSATVPGDGSAVLVWEDGLQMQFDSNGRLTAIDDANGNRTTLSYDGQGRLSQVSDAVGRSLSFTHDGQNRLTQVTDPLGRALAFTYDAQGNLATYTDSLGGVTTYTYDADHLLLTITDPESVTYVSNSYDDLGRVILQENGRNFQTSLLYGGDHTTIIDPLSQRATYFYDDRRRLTAIEDSLDIRAAAIVYDAADQGVSRTNGLGHTTSFAYDAWGHITTITDTMGSGISWGYDGDGNITSFTDQRGQSWQYVYDGQHNLTTVTDPLTNQTTFAYDNKGQLTQVQDPTGVFANLSYDIYGNLTSIAHALGTAVSWGYDIVGRPVSLTNGNGDTTQFSYDAADNVLQVTEPLGGVTAYSYDANNNLTGFTDANGHTTAYTYDAQFNLINVTNAAGGVTAYTYDANDNLAQITDPNNSQTIYQRDAVGRLTGITDPLNRVVGFTYDDADRLTQFKRADNSTIAYQRDNLGRLTGIDYPSGPDISYDYDDAGNLTDAAYGAVWAATYTVDDAGQLTAVNDSGRNLSLLYVYDEAGRRKSFHINQNAAVFYDVDYAYDAAGRLASLVDQLGSPASTVSFAYDAAGLLAQITDPSGARTDYVYDANGRLTSVGYQDRDAQNIAAYAYSYDAAGNPTAVSETTPVTTFTTSYTYDVLDRLTIESYPRYNINYSYDPAGNLTRRVDPLGTVDYVYDAADQLLSRGAETFTYDAHGNLATGQNARGAYTYAYDYENLLTSLTLPDSDMLTFTYDAFGRRLTSQEPVETKGFVYDGLNIVMQGNSDLSQPQGRYLYGNGILLGRATDQLGFTAYRSDALGNVRYLLDGNGQPLDAYHYDAYGRLSHSAGVDTNAFRYGGQRSVYQHDVTGWPTLLMGWRYYDGDGRFLTIDPWPGNGFMEQSLNGRAYALGNPISNSDFFGFRPLEKFRPKNVAAGVIMLNDSVSGSQNTLPQLPGGNGSGPGQNNAIPRRQSAFSIRPWVRRGRLTPAQLLTWFAQWRIAPPTRLESFPPTVDVSGLIGDKRSPLSYAGPTAEPAQWQPVANQGSSYALACAANDRLLAGSFQAGLWRSLNSGHSVWSQVYSANVAEIALADTTTYYAGAWYDGALKSSNGGDSWSAINTGLTANHVYALAINPSNLSQIFAGTEVGLFVSDNGGATWRRPAELPPGRKVTELAHTGSVLLAVTNLGLYRSADGETNWQSPTTDLPALRINTLFVGAPASVVYAGTALGLYRSTNGGDAWAAYGTGLADRDVHTLDVDPSDSNHLAAGTTDGLFVSVDGGANWAVDANQGLDRAASQIGALAFCPGGGDSDLYLGAGGGVFALRSITAVAGAAISGPTTGEIGVGYTFTTTVTPLAATLPITYVWTVTDQTTLTHPSVNDVTDTAVFAWGSGGVKTITVTAANAGGTVNKTYQVTLSYELYLPVILKP